MKRFLRLLQPLIVLVHLVHEGNVIQLKAVKGIKQGLVDLHALLGPGAVHKGQEVMGLGRAEARGEYLIGIVSILPALGPGISIIRMVATHFLYLQSEFFGAFRLGAGHGNRGLGRVHTIALRKRATTKPQRYNDLCGSKKKYSYIVEM